MVTVVKTPQGHKLIDQAITATITSSGGDALVTFSYHGLGTGDFVYITSDIDEYNGFWYITAINTDTFKISEYATADFVPYYQDADIEYYQTNDHVWSSIFLPIVYKLSNDRWPVNTVDTVRTISSTADDNGYLEITASGVLKSDIKALDYVKISNSPVASLNGTWQVVEVISTSKVVIDAAYTSTSLGGASIQFYYNNYQVKVKVYAGLPTGHPWDTEKPYEEMAELSLTPDDNNLVMVSIADYIKGKVAIKNNTTLFSLPLNLDAFTGFYISVAESFDTSDNYTISTDESEYVDDDFEGYAVAGKLPFKNVYSGDYADYIFTDGSPASWLTALESLIAVEDKYFDISFIKNFVGDFVLRIDKYVADYLTATEDVSYTDQGIGVYRLPITVDAAYDQFCVTVLSNIDDQTLPALSTWATRSTTAGLIDWTTGATPTVSLSGGISSQESSEVLHADYAFVPGNSYTVVVSYTVSAGTLGNLNLYIMDAAFAIQFVEDTLGSQSAGTYQLSITFTATADCTKIGIDGTVNAQVNATIEITAAESTEQVSVTEEICIDIIESCDAVSGFTPTDIRLLEDGSYRILE